MTKIQITQEDIDKSKELRGRGPSSYTCPIAIVVKRMFNTDEVSSGYGYVWINGIQKFKHTINSRSFMLDFDIGEDTKPQEIELEEIDFVSHGIKKDEDILAKAQKLWEENQPGG